MLLTKNLSISAMHIQLLPSGNIITFDRTTSGPSNISLPEGKCTKYGGKTDCTAHAVEFNPTSCTVRLLTAHTDFWCSSGGQLMQTGGWDNGNKTLRVFSDCRLCNWVEIVDYLIRPRWYASNQVLPNGQMIVVGGISEFSYEFVPRATSQTLYDLPFLNQTFYQTGVDNNLYPFLHLCPDGNLFVFANDRAIILDYVNNKVLREYPVLPGGFSCNYPSTGSSVMLPMMLDQTGNTEQAEVLICGGTLPDSYSKTSKGIFPPATNTCGRMTITEVEPKWEMEEMSFKRAMGDMILLPTGDALIINEAVTGSVGWDCGRDPVLHPVLYRPDQPNDTRFQILSPSETPRMYHSVAHLLPDGRVLVGGSNAHEKYTFTGLFPTDLSVEAFFPPYFESSVSRPRIAEIWPAAALGYNQNLSVVFVVDDFLEHDNIQLTMVEPSFTTHSFSMHPGPALLYSQKSPRLRPPIERAPNGFYFLAV